MKRFLLLLIFPLIYSCNNNSKSIEDNNTIYSSKEVPEKHIEHIEKKELPLSLEKPSANWKRIIINDIGSIDLSPLLEIQKGKYKAQNNYYKDSLGAEYNIFFPHSRLTLQPNGINAFKKSSLEKYCRVLVVESKGKSGDYSHLYEPLDINNSELMELDNYYKNEIINVNSKIHIEIKKWHPVELKVINGMHCIHISYVRQLYSHPEVLVNIYLFNNYDCTINLTISYRINEEKQWKSILNKTLESFRITNIK